MTAAIHFENEAFQIGHGKPMGRHFAGHGFLAALARHASAETLTGYVRSAGMGEEFCKLVKGFRTGASVSWIPSTQAARLEQVGCLFTPGPFNAGQVWQRELHGARTWSLCGVNHTLSSARTMDSLTGLLTAPVQPWDAIICTSRASRAVIETLFSRQEAYLSQRIGATRFTRPQLPVIPLGVDCESQAPHSNGRDEARAALGLEPADFTVLFLGRLSFHAKANPAPMYLALERLASRHRVVLIECGWTANEHIAQALTAARAELCPSVRSIVLDGREPDIRRRAWAAADVFCSLSDNIQETFGLTPIEAMASGLPVVVTDWDGYRDTVRDGIDGFAIRTLSAPPGAGRRLAMRHALEIDSYDSYIGQASTAVSVDIDATAAAFERLASDPDLRHRMGRAGAVRARQVFDWSVIVRAYEELWRELAELRRVGVPETAPSPRRDVGFWPARPDPFDLFASFPTARLLPDHLVATCPGIDEAEVSARLALRITMTNASPDMGAAVLLDLWKQIGSQGVSVRDILNRPQGAPAALILRGLLWLAKFGLLHISVPD